MAESSLPWDGHSSSGGVGDCGPYAAETWDSFYQFMYTGDKSDREGILPGVGGALAVSGTSSPVAVASGSAIVKGKYYRNSGSVNVAIATPSSATRIDRIVLRADYSANTIRITRIAGSEGGAAPAITQNDGVTWDIKLAQVSITTGGVITVTSERYAVDFDHLPGEMKIIKVTSVDGSYNPVVNGITYCRWFLCNGSTFEGLVTPNMADRFPIGVGTTATTQGATGGAATKSIAHTHTINITSGTESAGTSMVGSGATEVANGVHTHAVNGTSASGGSATQDVLNPYIGVYWFMYCP